jgi:hypothetical protein
VGSLVERQLGMLKRSLLMPHGFMIAHGNNRLCNVLYSKEKKSKLPIHFDAYLHISFWIFQAVVNIGFSRIYHSMLEGSSRRAKEFTEDANLRTVRFQTL